jgi:putative hydrolase of the HAD superfamily
VPHRAIIFDLGKTLIHFDFARGYQRLEGLCPHDTPAIRKLLAGTGLVGPFETGLVEPRDFVGRISKVLDLRADYDAFCEIWNSIFTEILVPEEMLEGLKRNYHLVLLSNTNSIHFESVREKYPLLRHFDDLVLSYEVKAMKPQPEIYRAAIECAGCAPEECFYTDDIAEFVEGARVIGIDAVQFTGVERLTEEMKARGIRW